MISKNLADLVDIFLSKKKMWNLDTNLKFEMGGIEMGTVALTGKIEYVPTEIEDEKAT